MKFIDYIVWITYWNSIRISYTTKRLLNWINLIALHNNHRKLKGVPHIESIIKKQVMVSFWILGNFSVLHSIVLYNVVRKRPSVSNPTKHMINIQYIMWHMYLSMYRKQNVLYFHWFSIHLEIAIYILHICD